MLPAGMDRFPEVAVVDVPDALIKILSDRTDSRIANETSLEQIQKEFARDNITEAEYLKRKKQLE